MNIVDSAFLCLDIGAGGCKGIAHRVRDARIDKSAVFCADSFDTVFAIKSVVDELERQIGRHFDTAYITGDFGAGAFDMAVRTTDWNTEHKITASDIRAQISGITPLDGMFPMHIVPLRYDAPGARNMLTPIGYTDRRLVSVFGCIMYPHQRFAEIGDILRRAHIMADGFFDPQFLHNAIFNSAGQTIMTLDLGAAFTSVAIWTVRGPVFMAKIPRGGMHITDQISKKLAIDFDEAERIKRAVASVTPKEFDRFAPADAAYGFSRADLNDILAPAFVDICDAVRVAAGNAMGKYRPAKILLTGGGAETDGITEFIENMFSLPVENLHADASVRALAAHVWRASQSRRRAYLSRQIRWRRRVARISRMFRFRRRRPPRQIPVMPSTLCFDMSSDATYSLFAAAGISIIHVDIMDGLYVDKIAGGIDELRRIRAKTSSHLHVHLMTESPDIWAADALDAGADTVIVSPNTSGVRNALRLIQSRGKRAGIALNPQTPITILKPVIRDIDEVMLMSVTPGAAGQEFQDIVLNKIAQLVAVRKKYGLKFKISVDGGINDKTAAMCWAAGADAVVSGSYLARAADFPLAVQSLLPRGK